MEFSEKLREMIDKSPFSVVLTAKSAGIGQSTLYEALRNEYLLSEDKTISVLEVLGASVKEKKDVFTYLLHTDVFYLSYLSIIIIRENIE